MTQRKAIYALLPVLFLALIHAGCSSAPPPNTEIEDILDHEVGDLDEDLATRIMSEAPKRKSRSRVRIEGEIKREIWWWIRYFSVRERESFARTLNRAEIYRPLVQSALAEARLPRELFYLAFIESSYVTHATSHTSAVGIWQFMEPTAKRFGLRVSEKLDERRHPIASTYAAIRYLDFLHSRFNSWYLAIAAYNAGEGRIRRAIREGRSTDFWTLADRGALPRETMEYLPKFLAATTIAFHLDKFGFNEIQPLYQWPKVSGIRIPAGMKMETLARMTGMPTKELLRFNPALLEKLRHARRKPVQIWVPQTVAIRYVKQNGELALESISKTRPI
ncbi:MAG: lytic transglycosylase domain-containing protein [Bdellovibrionales bacterium]|nr:lytic transglycosylase domain-containing protein [Bdellovibrionales bacterium]